MVYVEIDVEQERRERSACMSYPINHIICIQHITLINASYNKLLTLTINFTQTSSRAQYLIIFNTVKCAY